MLEKIKSPQDIKSLDGDELKSLADEIRTEIIATVAANGGHLASNLGMVEATLALHKVFNAPDDKIIFDVSHQSYTHKLLTGRYESFHTLREYGGVSGFMNRAESEYDVLNEGHSGTSVSAAVGIATANKLRDKNDYVVSVVGDGSLTNGMIYEALNNCAEKNLRLVILINDNDMSISKSIGGLNHHLAKIRTSKKYFRFKHRIEKFLNHIPLIGKGLASFFRKLKNAFKRLVVKRNMFDDLGLHYIGAVDGHNIDALVDCLEEAKARGRCCVVHMVTRKGCGYLPAELDPDKYHSVGAFVPEIGYDAGEKVDFSSTAGRLICERAADDDKICAITAAMCSGTGLTEFSQKYTERYFDVGIAEEHAVTFACGLAVSGLKPVLFLYSSFAQRVYDQIIHDISVQSLPLVLMLDRCGLVAGDGVTHQGIFDYSIFSAVPNVNIFAPETYGELETCLDRALLHDGLAVVRYPKGAENIYENDLVREDDLCYSPHIGECDTVIVTYGRLTRLARETAESAEKGKVGIIKLIKTYPVNYSRLASLAGGAKLIYVLDEAYKSGGVGEKISAYMGEKVKAHIHNHAVSGFVEHGSLDDLEKSCGFTVETITENIRSILRGINHV